MNEVERANPPPKVSFSGTLVSFMVEGVEKLGLDHFSAANAGGANPHALGGGAYTRVDGTQIHIPAPLGNVVGVADAVS